MKKSLLICLTLAGLLLRTTLLLKWEPFWYDEAFSFMLARLPLDRLLQATAGDVHPPLYYLMLKGWLTVFGGRETAARALSLVLSLGALLLYASLIRRMVSRPQAAIAWCIALFMPSLVYYSGEARMYALLECYVLAALVILTGGNYENSQIYRPTPETRQKARTTGLYAVIQKLNVGHMRRLRNGTQADRQPAAPDSHGLPPVPRTPVHLSRTAAAFRGASCDIAWGACGGLALTGAMLTHNAGLLWAALVVAAVYVAAIGQPDGARFQGRALIAGGVAVCLWAVCWGPVFVQQLQATRAGYWTWAPTLGTVAYMEFMSLFFNPHLPNNGLDGLLMLIVASLTTWGAVMQARRRPWLLLLALGFPVLAFVGSHVAGVGMLLHRLLVPGAFFVAILWAYVLTRRDVGRAMAVLLILSLAYVNILSLVNGRTGTTYEPVLSAITHEDADLIYGNNSAVLPLSLYTGVPAALLASNPDPLGAGLSAQTLAALDIPTANLEDMQWDAAWLLWFRIPGSTEAEGDYIQSLVDGYGGRVTVANLGDNRFTHGDLYRLEAQ